MKVIYAAISVFFAVYASARAQGGLVDAWDDQRLVNSDYRALPDVAKITGLSRVWAGNFVQSPIDESALQLLTATKPSATYRTRLWMQKIGLAGPEGKWFDCQVRRYGRLLAAFEVSPNGQTSSVPVLVGYDASGKDATDFDRLTVRMSEATRTDEVKALGKDISGSPFRGDFAVNYRMAALLHDVADAKTAKPYADIALVAAVLARDELAKTFSVAIGSNNVAMVQSMNWSLAFAKCVTEDIQRKFPPDLHSLPISAPSIAPPIRTSPVGSRKSAASKGANLPPFDQPLVGPNEVRVRNPNEFAVQVGVRSGNKGKDFQVAASGVASISVPDGKYDIYFVYSDNPEALYQGDSFTLSDNGVEIQIVKVVNGNYGIRRVR